MSISRNKKDSFEISINSSTILVRNHSQLNQLDYESSGHTGFASSDEFSSHIENTNNPHSVTKAQVGLENVEDGAQINIIEKVKIDGADLTPDVDKRITLPNKEPAFAKNTAFNKNFGSEENTVTQGNDARLSDARTPLSHNHGDITNEGKIGSAADRVVVTTDDGKITTASRSSIDSRSTFPPDAHTHDDRYYTESEIDTALDLKVDKVEGETLTPNKYTNDEKSKLSSLDTQAELDIKFGAKEDIANKGVANGYAPLNASGIVDPIYVPSAYTDYVEYATYANLPATGAEGTLYVVIADETSGGNTSTYRWTGSIYVNVTDKLSASEVKALYESNANTNAYTDDEKSKLSGKVDKNNAITAGTKTKITYDSKGLVTAGADLEESDIPTLSASKITQTTTARFVSDTEKSTWNGKQNALTAGDGISISGNVISADGVITVETWNTATKTLALSDSNKLFKCSHTTDQTVTIPTNTTVEFPIGTMITFLLTSTNKVTFSGASGVTLTSIDSLLELKTQYGMASLIKTDTNTWQLVGALE